MTPGNEDGGGLNKWQRERSTVMSERLYFDCNSSYGPRTRKYNEERWTLEHLLDDLDLAGIAGALVLHAQALEYDPMMANMRLVEEIEPYRDRLFPCWLAMPSLCSDFPSAKEFVDLARRHNVRAVRVEPIPFMLPLSESVWGGLRDALLDTDMLVTISATGFYGNMESFERFLSVFQENKMMMLDANWRSMRWVTHLMNEFRNLHIEFSALQANRAIEFFAGKYGAERCLFGTGLLGKAPGAARGFLDWTLLSEDDASKVAGKNLAGLLGGIGPEKIPSPGEWSDELTAAARESRRLPCKVLDDHCHILHDGGSNAGREFVMREGDADGMIELIRRIGIDKTAVMSWAGPLSGDPDTGNRIVAEAVSRYPEELVGVATVVPEMQSEEEIEEVIQEYHIKRRFPGLKTFPPRQTIDYDAPSFDRWYQFANDNHLYLVYDPKVTGPQGTPIIERLASKFPDMGLHLDHCGQSWPYARWAVEMVNRFPNVWAQLNFTSVTNGVIEYIAEHAGADRMLFGTDAPMRDPRPQAGWLVFTRLPEKSKRMIFGENFQRILDRAFQSPACER